MIIIRYPLIILLLCSPAHAASPVTILDPWIREAPPNMHHLAAYMRIGNESEQVITLVDILSEDFSEIEIHKTSMEDGMGSMEYVQQLDILPNKVATFKPGGYHLMLMGPKRRLQVGDQVGFKLVFANGTEIPVIFVVRRQDH